MIDGALIVRQFRIGGAMLNIYQAGHAHSLIAVKPTPGTIDLCFRWDQPVATAMAHLAQAGIPIDEGAVERYASDGRADRSVYLRDLDGNLLEFLSTPRTC